MQAFLPATGISAALQNNYVAPNTTGLVNWSMTHRLDYIVDSKEHSRWLHPLAARPFQSSRADHGAPQRWTRPLNYGQTYAPKTAVGTIEETHTFSPHLLNPA